MRWREAVCHGLLKTDSTAAKAAAAASAASVAVNNAASQATEAAQLTVDARTGSADSPYPIVATLSQVPAVNALPWLSTSQLWRQQAPMSNSPASTTMLFQLQLCRCRAPETRSWAITNAVSTFGTSVRDMFASFLKQEPSAEERDTSRHVAITLKVKVGCPNGEVDAFNTVPQVALPALGPDRMVCSGHIFGRL